MLKIDKNGRIEWTSNIAYATGLITTDGNLSTNGRHFTFVSKDIELIKTLKRCLELKNRIVPKKSGFSNKKYLKIQFGNVKLFRWLSSIGLKPNKKFVNKLKVPDKYFADFLRGHIDGDGCIRSFNDPWYPKSVRVYTVFNSANLRHVKWIRRSLSKLLGIRGWLESNNHIWKLTYAKNDSKKLLNFIYYSKNLPCLKRKRNKIMFLL